MSLRRIGHLLASAMCLGPFLSVVAHATDYRFCVSSDRRQGYVLVKSGPTDFGREWYHAEAAQAFCQVYDAAACSAADYDVSKCGYLPRETLSFTVGGGSLIKGLFSKSPSSTGQSVIEVSFSAPANRTIFDSIGTGARSICKWIDKDC